MRKGFDTSPLLDQAFNRAERDFIKGIAPEKLDDPETIPELLVHTVKRIHKTPTALMITHAVESTGLNQKQVVDVWNAMWERA